MTNYIKTLPTALLIIVFPGLSLCQTQNDSIDSIVYNIDNIITSIEANADYVEGISEGIISRNGKEIGGFESYPLHDSKTSTLYRIRYGESTDTVLTLVFYYKDRLVIYAEAEQGYWKDDEFIDEFHQKVYFSKGQVILENGQGMKAAKLYEWGLSKQKDYYEWE